MIDFFEKVENDRNFLENLRQKLIDQRKSVQEKNRFNIKLKEPGDKINPDGTINMENNFDFVDDDLSNYIDSDRSSSLEFVENKNFYSKGTFDDSTEKT
jgi:hypothetical protein